MANYITYESMVEEWRVERAQQANQMRASLSRDKSLSEAEVETRVAALLATWDEVKRKEFLRKGYDAPPVEPVPQPPEPPKPGEWKPKPLRKPPPASVATITGLADVTPASVQTKPKPAAIPPKPLPRTILIDPPGPAVKPEPEPEPATEPDHPVGVSKVIEPPPKETKPVPSKWNRPRPDRPIVSGVSWQHSGNRWIVTYRGSRVGTFARDDWEAAVEARKKAEATGKVPGKKPSPMEQLQEKIEFSTELVALIKKYEPLEVWPILEGVATELRG